MEEKIKTWSFSRLSTFEQCKLRAKLSYIDRIPEPPRPLPAGKTEHANDRGTRIHEAAELYVKGGVELLPELQAFQSELDELRTRYAAGKVSLEGDWAFTQDWIPTAWNSSDAWLRMKLDAFVHLTPTHGVVIDYKTGRKHGNEIKHAEQGQLYQLGAFMRYPELETIDVEFWYTDQDEISQVSYPKPQGIRFYTPFTKRGLALTENDEWQANPNYYSCRWCPYKPVALGGSGHCDKGV